MNMSKNKDSIVIYQSEKGEVELRADVEKDTIWATQEQIASVFATTKQIISYHVVNIFKEGELDKSSVVKESLTTAADGKKYKTKHYNLDAIIAVGYRVSSKKATQYETVALLGSKEMKGKLKGKIILKLTKELEPRK